MKNFKRVISAVIALALSASSLVAVSASKFSDVAETASCAEAVNVLTALKIVNGYEDGTFKPEGEITRAEAATMIVGALNMVEDAKAAAGASQFADVNEKASWATGYVNVGVAQGFISGMGDGTFAPQDNVTYAQMCVMLTKITGYADYAASYGGWPTGYTSMAANAGINKGVAAANDAKLTRGQVAQMLYNALTAPLLGVVAYKIDGNEYGKQDGTKNEFKTLLSSNFDGYEANVKITAVAGDTGVEKGECDIELTKAAFMDEVLSVDKEPVGTTYAGVIDDIGVQGYKFQEGKAILVFDENDELHIISFIPTSNADIKEYAAADYDSVVTDGDTTTFKFGSTKVNVPKSAVLYVNNAEQKSLATMGDAKLDTILAEAQGNVKYVKNSNGKIDKVLVDVYVLGQVTTVSYKNDKTTVAFTRLGTDAEGVLNVNLKKIELNDDAVEEGEAEVVVERNGEAVALKDLQEDDIIAIYTQDFAPTGGIIADPVSLKVLATDKKDQGALTSKDADDNEYVLNGTTYAAAKPDELKNNTVGSTLSVTLDPFGRIYAVDEEKSVEKYAIVTYYYEAEDQVTFLTQDGTTKTYDISEAASQTVAQTAAKKANVQDRVVTYKVKARTNEAYAITPVAGKEALNKEYNGSTMKVGNLTLADSTYIVDATKPTVGSGTYKKVSDLGSFAELKDDVEYTAYAWDKSSVDNTYAFVIVTVSGSKINADSRFAVAKKNIASATVLDDETGYKVTVLYDGDEVDLEIADDAKIYAGDYTTAKTVDAYGDIQGKAFFFTKDTDGLVDAIYVLADGSASKLAAQGLVKAGAWSDKLYESDAAVDVQLVSGIITDANSKTVTFGIPAVYSGTDYAELSGKTVFDTNISDKNNEGINAYTVASNCVVYTYDAGSTESKEYNKYDAATPITASNFKNFEFSKDSSYIWAKTSSDAADTNVTNKLDGSDDYRVEATTAFAMIVDGQVVAIYQTIQ